MNLETRKLEFVQEFLKLQSEEIISKFEKLLKSEGISSIDHKSETMSKEELNIRIDQSESDFDKDRFKSSSELLSKYK